MRSSNVVGCSSLRYFCIPADSNWNVPVVRPALYNSYVLGSSIGIESISRSMWRVWRIFSTASLIMDSVFNPKKSIFIKPVSSITLPSYWVTSIFSPVSLSSAVLTGTQSVISSRPMITPQAWTPVLRTFPSSIWAYFIVLANSSLLELQASCNSFTFSMQFFRFIFWAFPFFSGKRSGIKRVKRSDSGNGSFCTRATSLIANFVAIVP